MGPGWCLDQGTAAAGGTGLQAPGPSPPGPAFIPQEQRAIHGGRPPQAAVVWCPEQGAGRKGQTPSPKTKFKGKRACGRRRAGGVGPASSLSSTAQASVTPALRCGGSVPVFREACISAALLWFRDGLWTRFRVVHADREAEPCLCRAPARMLTLSCSDTTPPGSPPWPPQP